MNIINKKWHKQNLFHVILICFFPMFANAHSGGLDSDGGHINRQTGEYHCHRAPCLSNLKHSQSEHFPQNNEIILKETSETTLPDYQREDWNHWIDVDGDCQDVRAELLIEQSSIKVTYTDNKKCTVYSGQWVDPYTASIFNLASDIDVDHIVPLKWAHEHGGAGWSKDKKNFFANDIENLLIVDKIKNREKGSKGIGEWLPSNQNYQCIYAKKWLDITKKYNLLYKTEEVIDLSKIIYVCNLQ